MYDKIQFMNSDFSFGWYYRRMRTRDWVLTSQSIPYAALCMDTRTNVYSSSNSIRINEWLFMTPCRVKKRVCWDVQVIDIEVSRSAGEIVQWTLEIPVYKKAIAGQSGSEGYVRNVMHFLVVSDLDIGDHSERQVYRLGF